MSKSHNIVVGESEIGKTTLVKEEIIKPLSQQMPILICDVKGHDYRDVADARVQHPENLVDAVLKGHRVVRWKPKIRSYKTDEAGEQLDMFIRGADKVISHEDIPFMHSVVDEAHAFQRNNHTYSELLEMAVRLWRGYGAGITQIAQEGGCFKNAIVNNVGEWFFFRISNFAPRMEDVLRTRAKDAAQLPDYHFYHERKGEFSRKHDPLQL